MNILKKAEGIAQLLKQAADIEVLAKKKKEEKEDPIEDLDLDAIPTPDLEGKGLDELKTTDMPEVKEDSAFNQLKSALLASTTPTAAVAQCKDAILGEINNDPALFDQQVKDLLMLVAKDPELENTDSASLQAALESIKPKKSEAKEEAPAEPAAEVKDPLAPEIAGDEDLANAATDLPGTDIPTEEENAVDELASTPTASLFDSLAKTADVNDTAAGDQQAPTLQAIGLSEDEKAAIDNYAQSYYGMEAADPESIASNYINENGLENTPEKVKEISDYLREKIGNPTQTLMDKQEALDAMLKAIADYKEEASKEDAVIELGKTAASAEDFLSKVATQESILKTANEIDEKSSSPMHPGKKLFNGDKVTYTDGKQQYFPGQKVFQEREGGNPAVVSVFNYKGKPDVDVYTNKPARKNVSSINTKEGGTIAFFQPMHEEPTDITVPTDYTGVVTGEVQKKPEIKEQLAGAGHKVNDFLDKKFELADKKKVAGDLPTAKAAFQFNGLQKEADSKKKVLINFNGLSKQAGPNDMYAENNTQTTGTTTMGNDANVGPRADNWKERAKTLTPEQVMEAQQAFKDKEGQLQASAAGASGKATPSVPEEPAKDQLADPNTVDAGEFEKVKQAVQALPADKLAQVKEVADKPTLFKQKLEEVMVMTAPGETLPTLNDEGYKRLAKEVFQVEPTTKQAPAPAKPSTDSKKPAETKKEPGAEEGKGKESTDLDGLFKDLGL